MLVLGPLASGNFLCSKAVNGKSETNICFRIFFAVSPFDYLVMWYEIFCSGKHLCIRKSIWFLKHDDSC